MSAEKCSASANLHHPEARPVLEDLVRWSDVLVESFSPRGRAGLGLEYEQLAAIRPDPIMPSNRLFAQTGPLRRGAGFGSTVAAIIGFGHLASWPDRPLRGPRGAYTDYVSPPLRPLHPAGRPGPPPAQRGRPVISSSPQGLSHPDNTWRDLWK
jgi:crotonobetainyl-CoA:carnitine CoA-transferase CaiB-like acyl-CoA transferase